MIKILSKFYPCCSHSKHPTHLRLSRQHLLHTVYRYIWFTDLVVPQIRHFKGQGMKYLETVTKFLLNVARIWATQLTPTISRKSSENHRSHSSHTYLIHILQENFEWRFSFAWRFWFNKYVSSSELRINCGLGGSFLTKLGKSIILNFILVHANPSWYSPTPATWAK